MTTINNSTPVASRVTECKRCKAPHFTYQLTCKRCGDYLHPEDIVPTTNERTMAIAGGILAVSTVILVVCTLVHAF
jgi:hypothetical protein